ncbi:hypothetical protein VCHA50O407_40133 [Vibrio chagasii]|nr:hypothetical protein VCHA50P424_10133 [Vibrio chagasii]CAH7196443.1 hypothetical protein VCHA53O464_170089 [Vibrio chagasii]CAH7319124.1 hypothetical protein VCHA50O407_40133 [Vibrio chagasii]
MSVIDFLFINQATYEGLGVIYIAPTFWEQGEFLQIGLMK